MRSVGTTPYFLRHIFRNVVCPMFGSVEGYDPLRVVVLTGHQISDHRFEVGLAGIRLAPGASGSLETVKNEIDVLIAGIRHNGWGPTGLTHT
ncbi:hypothetical protein SAMN03159423_4916 [Bradyrhizobium sp. NFR13]|nr:hypothetical protein SAMN03159423_4916 [Bradyrhizobium sp. NFR13]